MNNSKIYVGNLSFTTTQNELQDMFAAHGTVTEANLINDRETGRARGFGFVTMSTADEAQNAINALHGTDVGGRTLNITIAKPREERSQGFGGGQRREFNGGRNRY